MTSTRETQREATVAKIAASEALKPAGQRLINRIPDFEDVERLVKRVVHRREIGLLRRWRLW